MSFVKYLIGICTIISFLISPGVAQESSSPKGPEPLSGHIDNSHLDLRALRQLDLRHAQAKAQILFPVLSGNIALAARSSGLLKSEISQSSLQTEANQLTTEVAVPDPSFRFPVRIVDGDTISTEVNLAICMPPPLDPWGRSQWDLLFAEKRQGQAWRIWEDEARAYIAQYWCTRVAGNGFADMHVVIQQGKVTHVTLQHNCRDSEFANQAARFLNALNGTGILAFPQGTQVQEIHLEVKMGRTHNAS